MRDYTPIRLPFLFHTSTISSNTISEFFGRFNDNFHYNPNKTESGCADFSVRTGYSTPRMPQNQSQSIYFLKKIWGSMPPDPSSCYVLYTPSTSTLNVGVAPSQYSKSFMKPCTHTHIQVYPDPPDGFYETLSHL